MMTNASPRASDDLSLSALSRLLLASLMLLIGLLASLVLLIGLVLAALLLLVRLLAAALLLTWVRLLAGILIGIVRIGHCHLLEGVWAQPSRSTSGPENRSPPDPRRL
jgi:hypothetical protein